MDSLFTALAQPRDDPVRVILGPLLVVPVVEHPGDSPCLHRVVARAVASGCGAHRDLYSPSVTAEAVSLSPGGEVVPGLFAREGAHAREDKG